MRIGCFSTIFICQDCKNVNRCCSEPDSYAADTHGFPAVIEPELVYASGSSGKVIPANNMSKISSSDFVSTELYSAGVHPNIVLRSR